MAQVGVLTPSPNVIDNTMRFIFVKLLLRKSRNIFYIQYETWLKNINRISHNAHIIILHKFK